MCKSCRDEQCGPRLSGRGDVNLGLTGEFAGFALAILLTIALLASCAQQPRLNPEAAMESATGYWDVVWAEPSIVASDSMFTLIQADWIDSSWVDEPPPPRKEGQTVMRFFIDDAECFVAINLVDNAGGLIRPLLAKKLRYGYYKLLVQTGPPVFGPSVERWVSLRYCNRHFQERLR